MANLNLKEMKSAKFITENINNAVKYLGILKIFVLVINFLLIIAVLMFFSNDNSANSSSMPLFIGITAGIVVFNISLFYLFQSLIMIYLSCHAPESEEKDIDEKEHED